MFYFTLAVLFLILGCTLDARQLNLKTVSQDGSDVTQVIDASGIDGCLVFQLNADHAVAVYDSTTNFTINIKNMCEEVYEFKQGEPPGSVNIVTVGTSCITTADCEPGDHGDYYVARLPRDGWSEILKTFQLKKGDSLSRSFPWDPKGDSVVNRTPAPEGFYNVYFFGFGKPGSTWTDAAFNQHLTIEVRAE